MITGKALVAELEQLLPAERIRASLIDRYAFACDAGFYYLLPEAVVQPASTEEIRRLFALSHTHRIPLTFRAGGTSLSGQSISDGILVDIARHWRGITALDKGCSVQVQPGAIGAHVNHALQRYQAKIGPDPASISAAMMGGILSNNSSGMCCGVVHNAYHTLQSLHFILPNGHEYNTAIQSDYTRFETEDHELYQGIASLRQQVLQDTALVEKIRRKYRIKNTVGYSINAFVDYEHPLDILTHLMIGAEGTLGFIAAAVLQTIPDKPCKITGMLFFDSPVTAAQCIPVLKATNAEALELMDRPALRSVEHLPGCPSIVHGLPSDATGVLCEYQSHDNAALQQMYAAARKEIDQLPLVGMVEFTIDAAEQATLWKLRKGMYPSVAAVRAKGTTAMLEDVAVPLEQLGAAVTGLHALFAQYKYDNAIIFGHAKEGNLHFLITQPVQQPEELDVFKRFNDDLAQLIIGKLNGSLKAEHGTGRVVAPYVKEEWGEAAYKVMCALKQLVDPHNLLNPGVIINADNACHLKHMKPMPVVEEEVDKCVECGYCENRCPSRDFTMTPRQRIQVRRALQRLKQEGRMEEHAALVKAYQYSGLDTCAVDGMCATDCPVQINTGELVKRLRKENHSPTANNIAGFVARHFTVVEKLVQAGIRTGFLVNTITGGKGMQWITGGIKKIFPSMPLWLPSLQKPVRIQANAIPDADVVYFPTCITRMMGADAERNPPLPVILKTLCDKAGLTLYIPDSTAGVCCGQLFSSKGFIPAYRTMINATIATLWEQTRHGEIPIVVDVTSCTQSLQQALPYLDETNAAYYRQLRFIDSIVFAADYLLPRLQVKQQKSSVVFHPVCSAFKMNLIPKLKAIGTACAGQADIPFFSGCCGMAGDRGFYYPGLTHHATRPESDEVQQLNYDGYYSSGKTCEMALCDATGKQYQSVLNLLYDCCC